MEGSEELAQKAHEIAQVLNSIVSQLYDVEHAATRYSQHDPTFWNRIQDAFFISSILPQSAVSPVDKPSFMDVYEEWILPQITSRLRETQQQHSPPLTTYGSTTGYSPPPPGHTTYQPLVAVQQPQSKASTAPPLPFAVSVPSPPGTSHLPRLQTDSQSLHIEKKDVSMQTPMSLMSPSFALSTPSNPSQPFHSSEPKTSSVPLGDVFMSPSTPHPTFGDYIPKQLEPDQPTINPSLLTNSTNTSYTASSASHASPSYQEADRPSTPVLPTLPDFAWSPFPSGNLTGLPAQIGHAGSTLFGNAIAEPEALPQDPQNTLPPPTSLHHPLGSSNVSIIRSDTVSQTELYSASSRPYQITSARNSAGDVGHDVNGPKRLHGHSRTGSASRVRAEPYPTSESGPSPDLSTSDSSPRPHSPSVNRRRGSSVTREDRALLDEDGGFGRPRAGSAASITSTAARRKRNGSASSSRPPRVSFGETSAPSMADRSPSTGMEMLHLDATSGHVRNSSFPNDIHVDGGSHLGDMSLFGPIPTSQPSLDFSSRNSSVTSLHEPAVTGGTGGIVRVKRTLKIDPKAVYQNNNTHVFVAYVPEKSDKVVITPKDVHELVLDPSNSPTSTLWQATYEGLHYTPQMLEMDHQRGTVYLFQEKRTEKQLAAGKKAPMRFKVAFERNGEVVVDLVLENGSVVAPQFPITFVHFRPETMVSFPCHPIGAAQWWRLPICIGKHLKPDLSDGSWTGRYDDEEPRRPSRLVEHFADCVLRHYHGVPVDWDPLGKLARAIRAPLRGKDKKRRAKSASTSTVAPTPGKARSRDDGSASVGEEEDDESDEEEEKRMSGLF